LFPAETGSGESDFVMARSATPVTVVPWVEELFAEEGSDVELDTVAVFDREPSTEVVATIVTVAEPDADRPPRLQVTVPVASAHEPCVGFAETKVSPAGSGSETVTPEALDGPALETASV
jgi:hypothetical protein